MLTTLANVKARLKLADSDQTDDDLLAGIIIGVSTRFEMECNRTFGYAIGAIEEFTGDLTEIFARYYPVDLSQPIVFQYATTFNPASAEAPGWQTPVDPVDFLVRKGCVIALENRLAEWNQLGRVTYSGGYVLPDGSSPAPPPGSSPPALPQDLQNAAVEQVAYWYQGRSRLGLASVSGDGGAVTQYKTLDLLPSVRAVLAKYERWCP